MQRSPLAAFFNPTSMLCSDFSKAILGFLPPGSFLRMQTCSRLQRQDAANVLARMRHGVKSLQTFHILSRVMGWPWDRVCQVVNLWEERKGNFVLWQGDDLIGYSVDRDYSLPELFTFFGSICSHHRQMVCSGWCAQYDSVLDGCHELFTHGTYSIPREQSVEEEGSLRLSIFGGEDFASSFGIEFSSQPHSFHGYTDGEGLPSDCVHFLRSQLSQGLFPRSQHRYESPPRIQVYPSRRPANRVIRSRIVQRRPAAAFRRPAARD